MIVSDGENGILATSRRPESIAERIECLLTEGRKPSRLADAARPSVAHLSWGASARRTVRLYHALGYARPPEPSCTRAR